MDVRLDSKSCENFSLQCCNQKTPMWLVQEIEQSAIIVSILVPQCVWLKRHHDFRETLPTMSCCASVVEEVV